MSPTALPSVGDRRGIQALAAEVAARPAWSICLYRTSPTSRAGQRGLPVPGDYIDLSNVVLIIGSEPVSIEVNYDVQQGVRAPTDCHACIQTVAWYFRGRRSWYQPATMMLRRPLLTFTVCNWVWVRRCASPRTLPCGWGRCPAGWDRSGSLWAATVDPDTGAELLDGAGSAKFGRRGENVGRGHLGTRRKKTAAYV